MNHSNYVVINNLLNRNYFTDEELEQIVKLTGTEKGIIRYGLAFKVDTI